LVHFSRFGMLYEDKSGNPVSAAKSWRLVCQKGDAATSLMTSLTITTLTTSQRPWMLRNTFS
jgi:hypothetical protein